MYIHDDEDVVADTLKSKPTPHRGSFEMIKIRMMSHSMTYQETGQCLMTIQMIDF